MHLVGVKMADAVPPRANKVKRHAQVCQVSAEDRAKQFKEDFFC